MQKRQSVLNRLLSITICGAVVLAGCSNVYEPLARKTTDEAKYEDAMKALNNLDYSGAITKFQSMSTSFLDQVEVRENYAAALAGKCGMNFADFVTFLSTADFSTTPFFKALMNQFTDKAIDPASCTEAETQIKTIWATNTATASEQFFMVMLSMAKMGAYLRNKADVKNNSDGSASLGDGTPDTTFNICTDSAANLTNAEVKEVVTGFSLMLLNITGFIGSFSAGTSGAITAINTACGLMGADSPCSTTDAANVTTAMVDAMRDLLATNQAYTAAPLGIGSCVLPTAITSCCP